MELLSVVPNTPEWLAARDQYDCASDAPVMMGASKYKSRSALLQQRALGTVEEIDAATQSLFDRGHAAEAAIRPLVEARLGAPLTPVVGVLGKLLASFDGYNAKKNVGWEHKLWNESLAAMVRAKDLSPHYYWQLEQQILVGGLRCVIFTCSDGTPENCVHMTYAPVPGRAEQLKAGWAQFRVDLANYQHVEYLPAPVGTSTMSNLPTLLVDAKGEVTQSNFAEFKVAALAMIGAIRTELVTDQDFADADDTVKKCAQAEADIPATKRRIMSGMVDVTAILDGLDEIDRALSKTRIALEKRIKERKDARRAEIIAKAKAMYTAHIDSLKAETGGLWIVLPSPDFAGAIKSLRTIASQQNAVDTALANGKIAADASAKLIRANLACMKDDGAGYEFLFRDQLALIGKPTDDLRIIIKSRIDAHKAAEAAKEEATRERIRGEEAAKLAKAQADKEAAERAEAARAEAQRLAEFNAKAAQVPDVAQVEAATPPRQASAPIAQPAPMGLPPRTATVQTLPGRQRPSAPELIEAVALHFHVSAATAADWLQNTDPVEYAGWPKSA